VNVTLYKMRQDQMQMQYWQTWLQLLPVLAG